MSGKTKIEWADKVWNPVTGCTPKSAGCEHCYAKSIHDRFMNSTPFEKVVLHEERLSLPERWKPSVIFVDSMGDLFHEQVPFDFAARVFLVMASMPQHTFMVLTKREDRMIAFFDWINHSSRKEFCTPPNIWMGVSIENQENADKRVPKMLMAPVWHRFVSVAPMLGPVDLEPYLQYPPFHENFKMTWNESDFEGIELVICEGESGTGARPMHPEWVRALRDQCVEAHVPFFFKQWGRWMPRWSKTPFWSFERWVQKACPAYIGRSDICVDMDGDILKNGGDFKVAKYPAEVMMNTRKSDLNHVLDGKRWIEMPTGLVPDIKTAKLEE